MKITLDLSWDEACSLLIALPDVAAQLDKVADSRKRADYQRYWHKTADLIRKVKAQIGEQTPNHRP